jgi:hypothetical protein
MFESHLDALEKELRTAVNIAITSLVGHVLEYMRDGVVSVAETNSHPSVSLVRSLKREFGFYCIELCPEPASSAGDGICAGRTHVG